MPFNANDAPERVRQTRTALCTVPGALSSRNVLIWSAQLVCTSVYTTTTEEGSCAPQEFCAHFLMLFFQKWAPMLIEDCHFNKPTHASRALTATG